MWIQDLDHFLQMSSPTGLCALSEKPVYSSTALSDLVRGKTTEAERFG